MTGRVFRAPLSAALSLIIILSSPSPSSGGSGSLRFIETTHDFGAVKKPLQLRHGFEYQNIGDKGVVITKVITACGCTAAVAGRKKLGPGESGKIEVTFDPAGKSGKFFNVIKVLTDASPVPHLLYIKGDVRIAEKDARKGAASPAIEVSPKSVDLGRVGSGQTIQYKIVVANIGEGPLYITNFHAKNRSSGVALSSKPIGKGRRVELTAYYIVDRKGPFEDLLVIRSNDPKSPAVPIRITGIAE